ncbi:MAG: GNAT family N-acetyltransferase [Bacteroidota bacterium]
MIRAYQDNDKDRLLELIKLNVPRYFAPDEIADFETYLTQDREDYFVVEDNSVVIGCGGINYVIEDATAYISWDIIHPNFHGKGIGGQLVHFRIAHIQEKASFHTVVVRTSQRTYKFYEKQGFELKSVKKDFWAPGFDLYYMALKL